MLGKKILVTGNIGSGKTTLCKTLSSILDIPAYHFDQIVWRPHWQRPLPADKERMTNELLQKKEWVIDAVSERLMEGADTIIFLDFPRRVSAWRTLKRNIWCRFRTRPEMPDHCPDCKQLPFIIRVIWSFPSKQTSWILEKMNAMKDMKHIVHIRNNQELRRFMETVPSSHGL